MSDIQRLTLISNPTNEFPKNANNSFKVGLPKRLTLKGDRWYTSLLSLTVLDQGLGNGVIVTDPHTIVTQFNMTFLTRKYITGEYRRVSFKTKEYHLKLDEIMSSKQPVTSGSLFMETSDARSAPQKLMFEQKHA